MLIVCNHLLLATPPVDNKKVFFFFIFFSLYCTWQSFNLDLCNPFITLLIVSLRVIHKRRHINLDFFQPPSPLSHTEMSLLLTYL